MRWSKKIVCDGDIRVRSKFLWFPLTETRGKIKKTRWLEKAKVEEFYLDFGLGGNNWVFSKFID
jgi:hypothetical protein